MAGSERANEATSTTPTKPGASTSASATAFPAAPGSVTAASSATTQGSGAGQRGQSEEGLGGSSGAATAEAALVEGLRCDLLMNARYHASREAFLDTAHRLLMFLIIVFGAAAVTDLLNAIAWVSWIKGILAAAVVIFAATDLTADISNRARTHALMKRRYFEMLADLTSGKNPRVIESQMYRYGGDEEPAFHALMATSWNAAQEMVYGDHADRYHVPPHHRALKNVHRFGHTRYKTVKGTRAEERQAA